MPGRVHPHRPADRDRPARMVPAAARKSCGKPDARGGAADGSVDPWAAAEKPPIAVVGSGPAGLINAYLLAAEGYPVTVFEAFHELGGVLRYGIPEFRLPNELIDDVVGKIAALGGRFVQQFRGRQDRDARGAEAGRVLADLRRHRRRPAALHERARRASAQRHVGQRIPDPRQPDAGAAARITRRRCRRPPGKQVIVIGGGNTAMDAARTARRLGGIVTIVYRRTQAEMPVRVEELHHALEEGIELKVLRAPQRVRRRRQHPRRQPRDARHHGAGRARRLGPAQPGGPPARPS